MLLVSLLAGLLVVLFSLFLIHQIRLNPLESKEIDGISKIIKQGSYAFLIRQFKVIFLLIATISLGLLLFGSGLWAIVFFWLGAILIGLSNLFDIFVSSETNSRAAKIAEGNLRPCFRMALTGGQSISFFAIGLGLLGLVLVYWLSPSPFAMLYYVFGASLMAFFTRLGGGIYTKSADIGADLSGKLEKGLPEDDQSNPAVIADQVGDNVGDLAGATSDLVESYLSSIVAAMILGWLSLGKDGLIFPICLAALGLLVSFVSSFAFRLKGLGESDAIKEMKNIKKMLRQRRSLAVILFLISAAVISVRYGNGWLYFWPILVGTIIGLLIGALSSQYTSSDGEMVKRTAEASQQDSAAVFSEGIYNGFVGIFLPSLAVASTIFFSYKIAGFYGVALAAVGTLSTLAIEMTISCFGPMIDNVGGMVRFVKANDSARANTEILDSFGNGLAAVGKSFTIVAAAFTVLAWLSLYLRLTLSEGVAFLNPSVLVGLFLGGSLTFLFCALVLRSVGLGSKLIIEESRRQFKEKKLEEGDNSADYSTIIKLAANHSLKRLVGPGFIALLFPLLAGWIMGPEVMGGVLAGSLITAFPLALFMSYSGAIWDNAKKKVEGARSDVSARQAAIAGDLIGDPLKDAIAPALNILIKLMGVVTLIFVSLFI